ncbi:MAG: two-component regulator propeller domain-containing protein [Verrucomicrobiota bacterium]
MRLLVLLSFLLQSTFVVCGHSFETNARSVLVRNWTTRDGLPHNRVRDVVQTRDGFVWIATDSGVSRFDGMKFKNFGLRDGLLVPIALVLKEDRDGSLWIGTLGGGLSVLRGDQIVETYTTADGLPSNWVSRIGSNTLGQLTVVTKNGSAVFDGERFTAISPNAPTSQYSLAVTLDKYGNEWVRRINNSFEKKDASGEWKFEVGGPRWIQSYCFDGQGRLWVNSAKFLWKRNRNGWEKVEIPEPLLGAMGNSSSMVADSLGTIWIASYRHRLIGYREGKFFEPDALPHFVPELVEKIKATSDGQIWLTSANGLFRLSDRSIQVELITDPETNPPANNLGGLTYLGGEKFMVATQGGGYFFWEEGAIVPFTDPLHLNQGSWGNALLLADDQTLWIGDGSGLFYLRESEPVRKLELPGRKRVSIWSLAQGKDCIWVGSARGELYRVEGRKAVQVPFSYGNEPIKAISESLDGTLWVGTRSNGLFRRKNGQWTRFGRDSGLMSEVIRALFIDREGRLWVGSDGGGLSIYHKERFLSITKAEGLPSDTVSQIYLDATGRLWLGTHRGLAVLSGDDVNRLVSGKTDDFYPLVINTTDGLPTDEFTIVDPVECDDGTVAFATIRGFVRLRPESFLHNARRAPVFLEAVLADGTSYGFKKQPLVLPAGTERLEIEYSGFFFDDPKRLEFRDRLVGLEEDWIYVGNRRTAEYRNLRPGKYRFEVQASNGNGLWSSSAATIEAVIRPYVWQRIWFQVAIVLLGACFVALFVKRFEKRKARRKFEAMRRREAVDQERARIARDLHDDVGASLTQMGLQSQLAERSLRQRPEVAGNHLQEIFKTARQTARSLDEIVWAVNPSNDVLDNFVPFLASFVQEFTDGAGLRTRLDLPGSLPKLQVTAMTRHHIYLALKETLHNVVKHAEATAVTLKVELIKGTCRITLKDNGSSAESSSRLLGGKGLENLKRRLADIGGTYSHQVLPVDGTHVVLEFPLEKKLVS